MFAYPNFKCDARCCPCKFTQLIHCFARNGFDSWNENKEKNIINRSVGNQIVVANNPKQNSNTNSLSCPSLGHKIPTLIFRIVPLWVLPICSGLGPVRVGAHMGPYGSSWTGLGRSGHVRFPIFDRFLHVSKLNILTKFLDDSAWFLQEKFKKHVVLIKKT